MKKIGLCLTLMVPFMVTNVGYSATLCGKISGDSHWSGGVFSVITNAGKTVATTNYIPSGEISCTEPFVAGKYIVRFSGAQDKNSVSFDGVYGCLTEPYIFTDTNTMTIVFNKGLPPFNGDPLCSP